MNHLQSTAHDFVTVFQILIEKLKKLILAAKQYSRWFSFQKGGKICFVPVAVILKFLVRVGRQTFLETCEICCRAQYGGTCDLDFGSLDLDALMEAVFVSGSRF